jgi:hypothetical protein
MFSTSAEISGLSMLHPVAVEVEVPVVGPEPDAFGRAGLVGAVAGIDLFISVGVEVGDDDQNELVQVWGMPAEARSRASIRHDSLPSTSPAWMLAWR